MVLKQKNAAFVAGQKAYDEFMNGVTSIECNMLYGDYLDYWMKEYFEINYKYSTAKRYKESFRNIKKELGNYKLSVLTPYILNQALLKLYQTSSTKDALRNYQKVIKSSLRDATYFGTDIIRYPFKIIHHELGINCRFYDLRGSFATISLRNGCEIKDIAEVLGHNRIETTEKYYISSTS